MKKVLISMFWMLLICASSCKKDKLPKATQAGENTFGCKIDGKIFLPSESAGLFGSAPVSVYNYPYSGFTLLGKYYGDRSDKTPQNVIIELPYLQSTGTYPLTTYGYGLYELDYAFGPMYRTNANPSYTGTVNITRCDTLNQIYSGTFSFMAIDTVTGKTVKVTDGRFDVKRHP